MHLYRYPDFAAKIIPAVRSLDLSNRPWENSYNVFRRWVFEPDSRSGDRLLRMGKSQQLPPEFTDRHDVVQTVCLWRNGTCYRIEIISRFGKPEEHAYVALLWLEEEQGGQRRLVRDVSFPWTHSESAEAALAQALGSLAAKLRYPSTGETGA